MTLAQWERKYDVQAHLFGNPVGGAQALAVFIDDYRDFPDASYDLYRLTDYRVSSRVSGPQLVLVPVRRRRR